MKYVRKIKTQGHNVVTSSLPFECYKVQKISDDVYEIIKAGCDEQDAKRNTGRVSVSVKKKGIYTLTIYGNKAVIKLLKETNNYRIAKYIYVPRYANYVKFDDKNNVIYYNVTKRVLMKVTFERPIVFQKDHNYIKIIKKEDYDYVKKILQKRFVERGVKIENT